MSYLLQVKNTYNGNDRNCYVGARHLREVLHRLENKHNVYYSGSRQNDDAMSRYINNTWTRDQIAEVHYDVVNTLAPKGRARWATNKSTPTSSPNISAELKRMKREVEAAREAIAKAPQHNGHAPHNDVDYVTSEEFAEHIADNNQSFRTVEGNHIALRRELLDKLASFEQAKPTIVHIKPAIDKPIIDLGLQHRSFPDLLVAAQTGVNIWLYGPAGTGKSEAFNQVARALGREFRGNGKLIDDIKLTGYRDGYGKFHETQFLQAYRDGHLYGGDELDSWSNEACVALQGALANGWIEAGGEIIKQHPRFLFIGAGNTTGKGATIEYVGRNQLDAAFLDRFIQIGWPHDDALEDGIVANKDWLAYVRSVRAKLATSDIRNHLVTMRASINGEKLLAAGLPRDKVIDMTLRRGLPQHSWDKIK